MAVAAVRFLGDARGDVDLAIREMEENQSWRLSYFPRPMQDTELLSDLKEGAVYFCGRDFALRPALVMRAGRVPFTWDAPRFARLFMFCMEYFLRYMAVPGRVENVCVIIDLQDISYRHMAIPALMELKEVFTHQNAGRVFCFYVCNMPFLVRALVNVVEAAMTERARQKIRFLSDVSQLQEASLPKPRYHYIPSQAFATAIRPSFLSLHSGSRAGLCLEPAGAGLGRLPRGCRLFLPLPTATRTLIPLRAWSLP